MQEANPVTRYEYKVVPAPRRAEKHRDARELDERFALTLGEFMNGLGAEGWEFLRSETLEAEDRKLLGKARAEMVTVLVFRREKAAADAQEPARKTFSAAPAETSAPTPRLGPARPEDAKKTAAE